MVVVVTGEKSLTQIKNMIRHYKIITEGSRDVDDDGNIQMMMNGVLQITDIHNS